MSDEHAPTLKPCPFCGGLAHSVTEYEDGQGIWIHFVRCTECNVGRGDEARDDAVEGWNRREPTDRGGIQEAKGTEHVPSAVTGFGIGEQAAFSRLIDAAETAVKRSGQPSAAGNSNGGSSPSRPDPAAEELWDDYRRAIEAEYVACSLVDAAWVRACDEAGITHPTSVDSARMALEHEIVRGVWRRARASSEIARLRAAQYEHAQWMGEAIVGALARATKGKP